MAFAQKSQNQLGYNLHPLILLSQNRYSYPLIVLINYSYQLYSLISKNALGSSNTGGIHIKPTTGRRSSEQTVNKFSKLSTSTPAF